MNRRHEPARFVRADGQEREVRRSEPRADFGEVGTERGIAGEVGDASRKLDNVSAPQRLVAVGHGASREVQGWDAVDRDAVERRALPPIEFADGAYLLRGKQFRHAQRNDECGTPACCQTTQGGQVEMIVMVVTDQHDVDRRKVLPVDAGLPVTTWSREGYRARAFRPDWVRQNIAIAVLKEHGRVVDQSRSQFAGAYA